MKLYRIIEKISLKIVYSFWGIFIKTHEIKNIYKKRKIWKQVILTKEQKKQIDEFYIKNYGKKIPYNWHRLYTSYTGKFDYKYVPEYIFSTELEKIGNKRLSVLPLENKNMINSLFENKSKYIEIPKTYLMKINGKFFDSNYNPISKTESINLLNNSFIIKKSCDSNSGKGVQIVNLKNGYDIKTGIKIDDLLINFDNNFIIQELVKQHECVNKIYEKSVNTLRVVTYITENGYHVAPIVMRIGRGGNEIDNAHAGGIFIGVSNDGCLGDTAFTEYQEKFSVHPDTNIKFKGYKLPNIDILRNEIIKLHKQLPIVKFISWDIAINDKNKFSLIEVNLHSQAIWINQMAHGKSFFEENTERILKEVAK